MNNHTERFTVERHQTTDQRLRLRLLEHQVRVMAEALRALADETAGTALSKRIQALLHDCRL
jgi:hypothetical protein